MVKKAKPQESKKFLNLANAFLNNQEELLELARHHEDLQEELAKTGVESGTVFAFPEAPKELFRFSLDSTGTKARIFNLQE